MNPLSLVRSSRRAHRQEARGAKFIIRQQRERESLSSRLTHNKSCVRDARFAVYLINTATNQQIRSRRPGSQVCAAALISYLRSRSDK